MWLYAACNALIQDRNGKQAQECIIAPFRSEKKFQDSCSQNSLVQILPTTNQIA